MYARLVLGTKRRVVLLAVCSALVMVARPAVGLKVTSAIAHAEGDG